MIDLLSATLVKLGATILAGAAKKTIEAIRNMVSDNEAKAIVNRAFMEFRENVLAEGKRTKDEKVLLEVFEEFFTDDRAIREFQFVFDAQSEKVDFDLLEEIFVRICIDKEIDIPTFDFRRAISYVIKEIEQLAQKQDKFKGLFQTAHLEKIYKSLQTRGKELNLSYARFKYLDQLQRHHNRLFFTGIPDLEEKKEIQLPAIFVMPRARESVEVDEYRQLMREKQGDDEFTGEEIHLRRMLVKRETEKPPIKFDTVFNESASRRFVVLGKPGSGKSTLLKFLVLEAARQHLENHRASDRLLFPILVEIRKFENALSKTNRTDYNILDFLYDSMRTYYNLDLPEGFFEKYLAGGRALLLFDGLDEVAAESRRAEIRQMIASFVSRYSAGNTVIVTSRIAGYSRAQFSTTDYRHFTLEDFDDEEINAFLKNWYRSRMANEKEAEIKANDLKDALEKKPRIKELARNPLLLTIIGIIHRYEAQLPEDRLLLYDKATEALLYTWDNVKDIIDQKFKPDDKRRFLEKVAFHLQSLEKGDEAGTLIDRGEVYKILFPDFCRIFGCDNRQAKGLVDEFLDKIRTRAGLLVEQSPDRYGFVHKTFQEYFAARWIANEALLNFDPQIVIDYVDRYIDNAFWHETLLLALRALPNKQAQKVLDHILTHPDPKGLEPYFYHHHYFVMKFIAEKGEWLNDKEFVETLINNFFRFSWNDGKDRSSTSHFTWNRFTNWVSLVSDSLASSILSGKLLAMAEDPKQCLDFRGSFAHAVSNLGMEDKAVVERLLQLVEDEKQDCLLRRNCATFVGKLEFRDISVVERLLHLVEDEKLDSGLRLNCAKAVGDLGLKDKAVVDRLLDMAEDKSQDGDLRRECAGIVGDLELKDETVIERLLHLAEDEHHDGYLRRECAEAMSKLEFKNKAMGILLILAEDEHQAGQLRCSCAEVVGQLGFKDRAVEILLHLAECEKQHVFVRSNSAEAVGNLGLKGNIVVERLLQLAKNEEQHGLLRCNCAKALGQLGEKNKAVEILLNLAEDEKQVDFLRKDFIFILGELGLKDKDVVARLLHLVEDEKQDPELRHSCAAAIGRLGEKDKTVVDRLLNLAEDENQNRALRGSFVFVVGKLGFKDEIVVDRLLRLAKNEKQGEYLRHSCAEALGKLGLKEKALELLLHLAEDDKQSSYFRGYCANTVSELGEKEKAVEILIGLYHMETDKYSYSAQSIYNSLWELTAV